MVIAFTNRSNTGDSLAVDLTYAYYIKLLKFVDLQCKMAR